MKPIYADYAAATPMSPRVLAAMQPFFTNNFYNPSSPYLAAQRVRETLEEARHAVAQAIGARSGEVIFAAGGTESCNMAIHGVMQVHPGSHIVVSSIEHEAVLEPASQYSHTKAGVDRQGVVSVSEVQQNIQSDTVLVSVMLANNEVGSVQPLADIARHIVSVREQRKKDNNRLPLYLHTDACQAGSYLDLHVQRLGVDLMTLNGGKMYGPKQSGILYVRNGTSMQPILQGGGQERGMRSGTENIAASVGFAAALQESQALRRDESRRLLSIRNDTQRYISENIGRARFNGGLKKRLPNNINVLLPGVDGERFIMELDERGIQAATGSACSASSDKPSHVLLAIGLSEAEASASVRLTFGRDTTGDNAARVANILVATYRDIA